MSTKQQVDGLALLSQALLTLEESWKIYLLGYIFALGRLRIILSSHTPDETGGNGSKNSPFSFIKSWTVYDPSYCQVL